MIISAFGFTLDLENSFSWIPVSYFVVAGSIRDPGRKEIESRKVLKDVVASREAGAARVFLQ